MRYRAVDENCAATLETSVKIGRKDYIEILHKNLGSNWQNLKI